MSSMGTCQSSQQPIVVDNIGDPPAAESNAKSPSNTSGDVICGSHLNSIDDLIGFPVFPEGNTSSVARFNTHKIWDELKDKKDAHGVSYKLCVFSGCKNVDSGIGVYAGSHDSYKTFSPLMDKVIEDYHGHKPEDVHMSDMDAGKLECPPLPEDEAAMIVSTRIRVGRNLDGYPLGPGVSKEQRDEIMQKVVEACNTFGGDLKGTFYPLEGMEKVTQEQLIADHFLFKEGDRFLEACGVNRDWPSGRGIFHNDDKTFLVWVNEEDQLRIISMQKGADIGAVFERLSRAVAHIETVAKFTHDDHLGYITSCPTNLGTALRASVHIKLPKLSAKKDEFQAIAEKYCVQIRGIHGEHSESSDGIFDISNKRRLGRSEVQLVQDMYDGVKAMIEREKELVFEDECVRCGPHLEGPDSLTKFPAFPDGIKSSMACFNTREVWEELKDKQDAHGVSYKLCIFSGCKNVDSGIGVYAGSHDSYKTFAPLMDKVIEDYHGHKSEDIHMSDMDAGKLECPPLPEDEAAMIVSTRIRVGRNLDGYPLGPGVSKEQRDEIMQKVVDACNTFEGDLKGTFYSLEGMEKATQEQLIADHFLFKEGDRFLEACGLNRDWPSGRGIFHNDNKSFLVWVNEEDQLRIISMQKGADIGAVFERLSRAVAHIETVAKFSHDDHLGYITSCPTNLGTALRASVHIKLPKLSARKKEFQAIADKFSVQIRGIHGEHSESSDGIYDISNKRRLGRSEVQLVQDMYNGVKAMILREKELAEGVLCSSDLEGPDSLTGFPIFPEGTNSSVARFNTYKVWNELKDKKDMHGVSYKLCIFSGCKNVDSGIGVYAGSHDSYKTFAPLMDKVIEEYHGHKPEDTHVSDMDAGKLECPPLPDDEATMIVSTRIRVGRNLNDYPLGPGVSKEQRDEIMRKVVEACNTFEGDLKGTFYPLEGMEKATQDQLIADHFLFKEGDRFLEACGVNRDWPSGRGIFHNEDKTFLVWVNEEDQLRIISMQKGADIGAVFERLSRAVAHIETVAKFSHDDHLGYITSCPTNLGTALRASVHIKLPKLSARKDEFQAIADKFSVQIRGIHGEHSESSDGIYDISNKRRLGRSEAQLVQDMYDGVTAMIQKEKELAEEDVVCSSLLRGPDSLTGFPIFPSETKSSLARFNTREVWADLKNKKDEYGVSYKLCIFSGCKNVDSGIGVYAGSHDSYKTFSPLMDKVIEDYHGHKPEDVHMSDMDAGKLECPPLPEDEAAMIVSTRIRVGRNLDGYPLGPGVSKEQRDEIMQKVVEACNTFEGDLKGTFFPLEGMEKVTQEQLIADHFLFKEGDRFLEACGLNRDWPSGRGIFHNDDKTFLVWVNEEDQLRIISMQKGADIGAVFERLSRAVAHIETVAKFSHDDHLGYITSCPTNLGTALRASVHIKLPKLSARKKEFQAIADTFSVQIRGIHGEHSESSDGIYDISNKRRLGRSEVQLVQDMYNGVKAMILREKELAEGILCSSDLEGPDSLTGFPIFPEGTNSSIARFNTYKVWNELKDKKDMHGVSYKLCIFSGCKNVDSGIGVYAGSHDSYKTFAPLMDKVIEEYHGHKPEDTHVSDMDAGKLECPPLPEDEATMIVSTRIRVGRNLDGYPLGPGVSKEQRDEIMQKVVAACSTFGGDLKGTFYPLERMEKATQDDLIADHFLFKEGDRFLEACGVNRDWPSGRGIFHNDDKTFLVWVNEEDQLRIISMQKGADIGAVFERLSRAVAHIETVAKFSHDDHLGYITSCPTNLGTALRASVHIKLPKLSARKDEFQAIADKFSVQIRGIHGEHSESSDGIYDISNKRRLGRSEAQLVQDMYDGVKAMIQREKEL